MARAPISGTFPVPNQAAVLLQPAIRFDQGGRIGRWRVMLAPIISLGRRRRPSRAGGLLQVFSTIARSSAINSPVFDRAPAAREVRCRAGPRELQAGAGPAAQDASLGEHPETPWI
jgi:hypothetical protein